jgi:hypothetical protein
MINTRAALISTQALSAALIEASSAEALPASRTDSNKHNRSKRHEAK